MIKKISVIAILVLLAGCIPYFTRVCSDSQVDAMRGILVQFKATALDAKANTPIEAKAIAFTIGKGYIVGLSHATKAPDFIRMFTPFGVMSMPRPIKDERFFANGVEVTLVGRFEDISVFYAPEFLNAPSIPWASNSNVKVGTKVYAIGYSFAKMFNFKDGIISILSIPEKTYGKNSEKCFMTTCPANPGDSGSPLIALHQGRPEIVGIVCATIQDKGMSFAFKADYVKETVNRLISSFEELMEMG